VRTRPQDTSAARENHERCPAQRKCIFVVAMRCCASPVLMPCLLRGYLQGAAYGERQWGEQKLFAKSGPVCLPPLPNWPRFALPFHAILAHLQRCGHACLPLLPNWPRFAPHFDRKVCHLVPQSATFLPPSGVRELTTQCRLHGHRFTPRRWTRQWVHALTTQYRQPKGDHPKVTTRPPCYTCDMTCQWVHVYALRRNREGKHHSGGVRRFTHPA
jgi:hypothetical protein